MFALENVGFLQKEVGGDDGDDEDDNFIEDDDEANAGSPAGRRLRMWEKTQAYLGSGHFLRSPGRHTFEEKHQCWK